MNKMHLFALATLVFFAPSLAYATTINDYFPNCSNLPASASHILTVDPSNHAAGTYSDIVSALQAAKPGDTIALMTGEYGDLVIDGANQGFITIAAAFGQTPNFSSISIGAHGPTSHWRLTGLTVSGFVRLTTNGQPLQTNFIMLLSSDNIFLDHNNLYSQDGKMDWQPLRPGVPYLLSGITARQSTCISIVENKICNVFHGIDFGGDQKNNQGQYYIVNDNTIDNFAGDGIEHYGSHVRIERNRITNGHDVCNNICIHSDGIQGWNYNHMPVQNSDVTIDGNVIIAQLDPNLALPIDTLQGITIFDGRWDNVRVFNNLIVTDAWHGITFNRVSAGSIINNTIAPTNPGRGTWIMVNEDKNDAPGTEYHVVVRNNVTPTEITGRNVPPGVIEDHNIAIGDLDDYADAFVKFDPQRFSFDLHPSKRSPVIGAGAQDGAPPTDIEGSPRHIPEDVGAYAFQK